MLVTAIALFFSTFSSPLLSAALTFGLYVVGHFNADLRNFDQVVDSPAGRVARARPVPRPAELRRVRRQDAGRARPAGAGRLHRHRRRRTALAYIAALLLVGDVHLLAAGFQVTRLRPRTPRRGWPSRWRAARRAAVVAADRARSRIYSRDARHGTASVRRSPDGAEAAGAVVRRAARRRLLDPRDSALRRRAADARRTRSDVSNCCIRCSISRPRSIRTSTSPTGSARSS